ncbi:potassium transporter Trk [Sphaerisporangium siamense]|uniref:Potassium uptake TrkH family protein n=1 Tax=Sphaerisporangium siamense TaxID=795645 RepID=A0A7W7DBR4_9ACTN|nr:potassium transporter TrkG [Sphaerisporangium siamense]MBB4703892.1 potassium uptake TrkH family protein [Sphaerisporangium siamense]GII82361.1 potassium transporter Trk [Sphaerisporangium siamense]
MRRPPGILGRFQHPAQVIVTGFAAVALIGSALLALPIATESGESAGWLTALFTATSAVCVTGLVVVDTATHWSMFGEWVVAGLVQVGGIGIMTLATLFTVLVAGRLGLRARIFAQAETKTLNMTDVRRVVRKVVVFSLACEAVTALVLTGRFLLGYGEPFGRALYQGVFHAISAFNNAGFALWPDSLTRYVTDPWICLTIAIAVIVGGLGFPVMFELSRGWRRPSRWSVLTRITVGVTAVLLVGGTLVFLATEWRNPKTLGALDGSGKLLAAFFTAVMPRSGGFNSLDLSGMYPTSWLATDLLMFIGGGSAGTAGGIKVTTFGLLAFVIWAELRGEREVNIGHRRLTDAAQRQAVSIGLISVALVAVSTYLLLALTSHGLDHVLFEVVSAFATVGLSTGITADTTPAGQVLLTLLMFIGRTGPLTLGSALALKDRIRRYQLPEENVIVG